MIILDATTQNIKAVMGAAQTTTNPDFFASYVDVTTTTYTPAQNNGTLNGVTAVNVVTSPAGSTQRQCKFISIFNRDSVTQTITITHDTSGTGRTLYKGTLAPNECIQYVDGEGWSTLDANGVRKYISTAAGAAVSFSYVEPAALVTATSHLQGTLFLQRFAVGANFNPDVGMVALIMSNSSSAGFTYTINMGLYTFNGSTLSLASSTTRTIGANSTAAASSVTRVSGTKMWSIPTGTWNLTPGDYVLGLAMSIATSGTSGSYSYYFNRCSNSSFSINGSEFGGGTGNVTNPIMFGAYSAATNTLPNSIAFTQVNQTGAAAAWALTPWFALARTS